MKTRILKDIIQWGYIMKRIKKIYEIQNDIYLNTDVILKKIDNMCDDLDYYKNKVDELVTKYNSLETEFNNFNITSKYKLDCISNQLKYINPEVLGLDYSILKKRVLLVGFYGAPNLGDELMLEVLVNKLKNYSNIDLTVMLSENRDFDLTNYSNFKVIHYPKSIIDINAFANYFDVVIFGGGALIDDRDYNYYSNQLSLSNTLINLTKRMIDFGKKTILYGLSTTNILFNKEYIDKLNYIVSNCTYISLRDTNSLDVLKNNNIDVSRIKIVNDLVFSCNYLSFNHSNNKEFIKIAINYICSNNNYDSIILFTKSILEILIKNNIKYKIVFIPFYEYTNNDSLFYKKLIEDLNDSNFEISEYPLNFSGISKILQDVDYTINMRYHGTLISNLLGIPNLNIIYDIHPHYKIKMSYLKDNYNFNFLSINYSDLNKGAITLCINNLLNNNFFKVNTRYYYDSNKDINDVINEYVEKDN